MKGLADDLRLRLLEHDPTPTLKTMEEFRLSIVLSRFRKHNLRVKASKCCFGASKAPFRGHSVSEKGVHADPKKIEAVSNLAPLLI